MKKSLLFFFALCVIVSGCRSRKQDELPEVKPLPGEEKVHVTLNVNISDNTAQAPAEARKKTKIDRPEKVRASRKNQIILSPKTRKDVEKKQAQRKRKELVPSGVGIIDSELNSVEQSYLREVRARREQQVRTSEQQVFGSFSPGNIFKAPAE